MTSALKRSLEYLLAEIAKLKKAHKQKLPHISVLIKKAQVSRNTMCKAIALCKQKGILVTIRGKGTMLAPQAQAQETTLSAQDFDQNHETIAHNAWQRAKENISYDILNGVYTSSTPMPSYKQLCARYSISYSTLRKALNALINEKAIEQSGHIHRIASPGRQHRFARIVLIGAYGLNGRAALGLMHGEYMRFLEASCIKSNIALDVIHYRISNNGITYHNDATQKSCTLEKDKPILGYLICAGASYDNHSIALIKRLSRQKKPIAVFVQRHMPGLYEAAAARAGVKLYPVAYDTAPGEIMGRHLIAHGHRNIAYLSHLHSQEWSPQRYKGLCNAFKKAGFPDAVHAYTLDKFATADSYRTLAQKSFDVQPLRSAYTRWLKRQKNRVPEEMCRRFESALKFGLGGDEIRYHMLPKFEQALANRSITAWVAATDGVAVLAADFLAQRGKRVPQKISLAGFDDSTPALERGIT